MFLRSFFLVTLIIIIFLLSIFIVKYYDYRQSLHLAKCNVNSSLDSFASFNKEFNLIHEDGFSITKSQLINKPSLIYFGYTYCPDICPFDLMRNSQAIELLEIEKIKIKPLFVTLDPNRDTLSVLREYTDFHHKDMIGLTGSPKDIDNIKKIFKIYSDLPSDLTGDYIINHSTFTYFIIPKIGLVTYFTRKDKAENIAKTIKCILKEYKL